MRLPRPLLDRIVEEARRASPRECCGLLAGRPGAAEEIHPLANVATEPLGFRADPAEQSFALTAITRAGRAWIGTYHSHAADVAAPSGADLAAAARGPVDRIHLVVSLLVPPAPRVAAYRMVGGRDIPEEVIVT